MAWQTLIPFGSVKQCPLCAGWGMEVFSFLAEAELQVESEMFINGQRINYRTIYHKKQ